MPLTTLLREAGPASHAHTFASSITSADGLAPRLVHYSILDSERHSPPHGPVLALGQRPSIQPLRFAPRLLSKRSVVPTDAPEPVARTDTPNPPHSLFPETSGTTHRSFRSVILSALPA